MEGLTAPPQGGSVGCPMLHRSDRVPWGLGSAPGPKDPENFSSRSSRALCVLGVRCSQHRDPEKIPAVRRVEPVPSVLRCVVCWQLL